MMNMPEPMTRNNYDKLSKLCGNACETVAEKSMTAAAEEIKSLVGTEIGVKMMDHGNVEVTPLSTVSSLPYRLTLERYWMSKQCLKLAGHVNSMRELEQLTQLNMIVGKPLMFVQSIIVVLCLQWNLRGLRGYLRDL